MYLIKGIWSIKDVSASFNVGKTEKWQYRIQQFVRLLNTEGLNICPLQLFEIHGGVFNSI